jgi:hypothetical protein
VIGVGGQVYGLCKARTASVRGIVFSDSAFGKDKTGLLEFANLRAQAYWSLRELLDPTSPDPSIALPPDRELRADLTAPRYKMLVSGIQIESKADIKARLGRSTDSGDAAVLAFWNDPRASWASAMGRTAELVDNRLGNGRASGPPRTLADEIARRRRQQAGVHGKRLT